jgi:glycerol-3-phosphate cytidylyltransferase-like family protein
MPRQARHDKGVCHPELGSGYRLSRDKQSESHELWMPDQVRHDKNYLITVVARDKTVLEVKGKLPRNNEKKRMARVKKSGLADRVVLGRTGDKYALIKKYKPDMICLGYDQKFFIVDLRKKIKEFGLATKIKRLKPYKPHIYKSSIL